MGYPKNIKLQELIEIEGVCEELLDYGFSGEQILLWPFIRHMLFSKIILESNKLQAATTKVRWNIPLALKYIISLCSNIPVLSKQSDIVIIGTDITNIRKNDIYFNRVSEYFFDVSPSKTILIERSNQFRFVRDANTKAYYRHDFFDVLSKLLSNFIPINKSEQENIDSLISYIGEKFNRVVDSNKTQACREMLKRKAREIRIRKHLYKYFFTRVKPKIIFIEEGYYGSFSDVISIAKDLGIQVGEFQHGLIGPNHVGYNYPASFLRSSKFQKMLPDFFLGYGEKWTNWIDIPGEKINIGNPHLTESIGLVKKIKNHKKVILLMTAGMSYENFCYVVKPILTLTPNYRFILRVSPFEKSDVETRYGELLENGVELSVNDNLYDDLSLSDIVLTEFSTVLFESLAFGCPVIIIENAQSIENSLMVEGMNIVKDYKELLITLKKVGNIKWTITGEEYWAGNWKKNYIRFLNKCGIEI